MPIHALLFGLAAAATPLEPPASGPYQAFHADDKAAYVVSIGSLSTSGTNPTITLVMLTPDAGGGLARIDTQLELRCADRSFRPTRAIMRAMDGRALAPTMEATGNWEKSSWETETLFEIGCDRSFDASMGSPTVQGAFDAWMASIPR